MPLFNIITVLFSTSRTFAFYGGYLPLIRVCMPCSDESGWYISNFMFYVLQVIHLLIILVLLFILLLVIVWQVFVLLWINSCSCKAADGLITMIILFYGLLQCVLEKDYWLYFSKINLLMETVFLQSNILNARKTFKTLWRNYDEY